MGYLGSICKFGKKVVDGVAKFGEKHKGKIALVGAVATFAHSRREYECDEPPSIPDHLKQQSRHELHELLSKPSLAGIPVLVLGNKNDVDGALKELELIEQM